MYERMGAAGIFYIHVELKGYLVAMDDNQYHGVWNQ